MSPLPGIYETACPLDCPDTCGLQATVVDGKITKLAGSPNNPYTAGIMCSKMRRFVESRLYGKDRLLYPLLRSGTKGAGQFSRISWDKAFEICAERLLSVKKEFGGEAILPFSYAGNMGKVNRFAGYPFFHKLGTLQLRQTICSTTGGAGWAAHCGNLPGASPETAAESDCIVVWGINVQVTNMHFYRYISQARKRGAKLIVIDPCRNETAQQADMFLQVMPGGDIPLALCAAKIMVESGQEDAPFLQNYTTGYDTFKGYLAELNAAVLAEKAGVSLVQIEEFAALLGSINKTFVRIGMGLTRNSRGGMAVRAITSLMALSGHIGGGEGRGVLFGTTAFTPDSEVLERKSLLAKETPVVNMIQLGTALVARTPKIRALVVYNANPAVACPDTSMVRQGLAREDLFTIVHEQVMTPTARYADLLLPATTFLENHDFYTAYGHFYMTVAQPVISPIGEAKSNFDFFQQLARKMGFTDAAFQESCEQRIAACLRNMGGLPPETDITTVMQGGYVRSTRKQYRNMVDTEKVFHFVVESAQPYSLASLSEQGEAADPDMMARYPLHLITPPQMDMLNSTFGDLHGEKIGRVIIHPKDAETYGIIDGDLVILENFRGSVCREAVIRDTVKKGVLAAYGLYWGKDSTINDLTSQKTSDIGGGATFHESLVRIRKI